MSGRAGPQSDLATMLDYNVDGDGQNGGLREASMLCAPLITRED